MPLIYLQHPVHGTKVATLDIEADFDEQNGWKRYNPDTPSLEEAASATEEQNALIPARRGRPRKVVSEGE